MLSMPRDMSLTDTQLVSVLLISAPQASRRMSNKLVLFVSHPTSGIMFYQPGKTKVVKKK